MTLYINACVRENSRTDEIAKELLSLVDGEFTERKLDEMNMSFLSAERLEYRTKLIEQGNYNDSMFDLAKEFANADKIVISAPFWDLSFPTLLKMYIENIYVTGIVSKYSENGIPQGLCKAQTLYYVTTAGGEYDPRFSFDYIKELCTVCLGIPNVKLIKAQMLDVVGFDAKEIVENTKQNLKSYI